MSEQTHDELVHYEVDGAVATITLDSPHNRNALSVQLVTELVAHLEAAQADPTVLVVLLRSSGRVFCSGADLAAAATVDMRESAMAIVRLQRLLVTLDKAVVTELGGPVRAGGIGIVAASDVVIASEESNFALTEVKLGVAAAIISLTVFHRMNPRAASWTALGGAVFSGAEAAAYGLVTRAVPAEELESAVRETVEELATGTAQGLREAKRILNRELVAGIDAYGEEMAETSARLFASDEAREAMLAFLSRKK